MACIGMQFGGAWSEVADNPVELAIDFRIPICCICMESRADFAIYCGHVVQCTRCADKAPTGYYYSCPRCNKMSHFGTQLRY